MRAALLVFTLVAIALTQQPNRSQTAPSNPALHGTFTATAGRSAVFRGRWTGEANSNSGGGSWVLLNDSNKILAEAPGQHRNPLQVGEAAGQPT